MGNTKTAGEVKLAPVKYRLVNGRIHFDEEGLTWRVAAAITELTKEHPDGSYVEIGQENKKVFISVERAHHRACRLAPENEHVQFRRPAGTRREVGHLMSANARYIISAVHERKDGNIFLEHKKIAESPHHAVTEVAKANMTARFCVVIKPGSKNGPWSYDWDDLDRIRAGKY